VRSELICCRKTKVSKIYFTGVSFNELVEDEGVKMMEHGVVRS
jgi:hypothetical protein